MLDAASLLMNQYATVAPAIVSNPVSQPPPVTTDSSTTTDSPSIEKAIPPAPSGILKTDIHPESEPSTSTSKLDPKEEVTIEDLGADEDHIPNRSGSPTMSSLITPTSATTASSSESTSTDLNEVRRRWNQKFAQNNTTQSQ